ncbi:hypothetical protein BJV78DRAFT_1361936 [Lactifluus subvellereus]|nr:hypothetical protein BJV78DRAFT_1361936 [Lactifluus subvellereus]
MSKPAILAPLLLLSGVAVAQIYAPADCIPQWQWTSNSLGQNACTVAAYLMGTCNRGAYTVPPLEPGESYSGPSGDDDGNLCKCSTVAYSLLSACDACQQETWIDWSEYSTNCTRTMNVSSFPNPVPSGTRVPQWALLDVTLENSWNNDKSFAVGDSLEIAPGTVISPSNASSTSPTPTPTLPTPSPTPTQSSSLNAGAIAVGVFSGVAAIAVAGLAIFFWLRRKRSKDLSAASVADGASQSLMGEVRPPGSDDGTYVPSSKPGTPATPMNFYDPNDPTTFPRFQGAGQVYTGVPVAPYSGNTLPNIQTSPPPEYHSLPII